MTQTKIIIGIGVLIGILLYKQTEPKILKGILVGLVLSYGGGYFLQFPVGTIAFISFGIVILGFTV